MEVDERMTITLGMITKNSLTKMGNMLVKVLDRALEFSFDDLLVADDGSDGTRALFLEKGFRVIDGGGSRGEARQRVIENTKTDWLFFLDDDILLDRGWFERMKPFMKSDVGLIWGSYRLHGRFWGSFHIRGKESKRVIKGFQERGGTHDTMLNMDALKGIKIPWFLNWYEDAFIRNYVRNKGYKIIIINSLCDHLKPLKIINEEMKERAYEMWRYQMCQRAVGVKSRNLKRAFRTLAATPLKALRQKDIPEYAKMRAAWLKFYLGLGTVYPSFDPEPIRKELSSFSGKVAYDIGANIGAVSNELAKNFEKVYSFEPSYEAFSFLSFFRKKNVYPYNIAISDTDSEIKLLVNEHPIKTFRLTSEMREQNWGRKLAERTVKARTIDSLVQQGLPVADFVKIDVEGHELNVLKGAEKTISSYHPRLFIEVHSQRLGNEILTMLEKEQYKIRILQHPDYKDKSKRNSHFWIAAQLLRTLS